MKNYNNALIIVLILPWSLLMAATSLTNDQINHSLQELPGWHMVTQPCMNITKTFTFPSFEKAMRFVNSVANLAQKIDHHPDISVSYTKVTLALCTHDINGVSQKDLEFAHSVEMEISGELINDSCTTIENLRSQVESFVCERDWVQFHSLKNLSMAIAIEAAELMEHFTWLDRSTEVDLEHKRCEIENELVDVLTAAFAFANRYNVDITTAFLRKLALNKKKYPIDKAKGRWEKYTAYQDCPDTQK